MSTTNGAGEPSMEEILASIRNIIAQDPPTDVPEAAPKPQANGTPTASGMKSQAGEQSANGLGAASLATAASTTTSDPLKGKAPAALPVGGAPSAGDDDFSDVFEEPLQRLPVSSDPFGQTDEAPTAKDFRSEPQLPQGKSVSETFDANESSSGDMQRERKEFDFGALRASRPSDDKSMPTASELFGIRQPRPAAESVLSQSGSGQSMIEMDSSSSAAAPNTIEFNKSESTSEVEDQEPASSPPTRRTVIAAMSSGSNSAVGTETSAKSSDEKAIGGDDLPKEAKAAATAPADFPPPRSSSSSVGLKTANVGFLAASPKPLDAKESSLSGAGRGFFESVAGVPPDESDTVEAGNTDSTDPVDRADTLPNAKMSWGETLSDNASEEAGSETILADKADSTVSKATDQNAAESSVNLAAGLSAANIVVSSDGGKVRTLEDTVAELLRPLLREWLENNMPRIVESALRLEVADSVKKQLESATGKPNGLSK